MSSLRLRFGTVEDVPLILEFIRELAVYERLADSVFATEEGIRNSLFGNRKYAEVVLAEWQGQNAGFALFFHNFSTFLGKPGLYLEDLFVRPEFRCNGIGKALLIHLARIAEERGCGRMEWWVLDWNEPAIGFYKSLGAEAMDEWTVYRITGEKLSELAARELPALQD